MDRRGFLRMVGAMGYLAAVSALLEACSRAGLIPTSAPVAAPTAATAMPTVTEAPATATSEPPTATPSPPPEEPTAAPSPTPTETEATGMAKIAFVKTSDRTEGVRRALDLLGHNPVAGKRVFLKPNFNSADPAPGSTHPDVLRALVVALQELGAQMITVGDRSGMGDTRQVMQRIGVFELAAELGFETLVFDEMEPDNWQMVQPSDSHWEHGFFIARPCLKSGALVQACCLKTHRFGGHFTMSLKNSVGMVAKRVPLDDHDYMTELHNSPQQRTMIAEINAAYTPALIVMDGVEAFTSGGPDAGELVSSQVVLAGTDRIAIDAAGVALLRYFGTTTAVAHGPIFEQEQIARAVELGLGVDGPERIEFVTGDADSAAYADAIRDVLTAA